MQILTHKETSLQLLRDLGVSLKRDIYCWAKWHIMHVTPEIDSMIIMTEDQQLKVATMVRTMLPDNDGGVLCMHDGTIVVLYREHPMVNLTSSVRNLNQNTNVDMPKLHAHNLSIQEDPEHVLELILHYVPHIPDNVPQEAADENLLRMLVPHVKDFLDAWLTICEMREGRSKPQIMIVDDDPVARRIVSRALKKSIPS